MPQERAGPPQDVGSSPWAVEGSSQLDTFQAAKARCQVQKRARSFYALCSKVTHEPRAGMCEGWKMLLVALIQMC